MSRLSFSLPKYDGAMEKFYDEFNDELHMQDDLLRRFPPTKVLHSGTTRFLSKPAILEAPYKHHNNTTSAEIEIITQTNIVKFKDFLLDLIIPIRDKLREHTEEIINQTCDVTGNKVDAKNQNIWDAYIEAIEKMKMIFDADGNPNFLIHPPKFYEKLSQTEPTPQQIIKVEEIFKRKKEQYFLRKNSRRLTKSTRKTEQSTVDVKVDVNTLKTFLSLPKYNRAVMKLIRDVKEGFISIDPILGQIRSIPLAHGGVTRQVSEPQILETPMKGYSVEVLIKLEWFRNTDIENFRDFLFNFAEEAVGQMKKHFFDTFPLICDATGNNVDAKGKNIWDAYIEMLETAQMHFDENGNHNYQIIVHPDTYEKFLANPPSPEQLAKGKEIMERKKKEFYAQKRTRRLS